MLQHVFIFIIWPLALIRIINSQNEVLLKLHLLLFYFEAMVVVVASFKIGSRHILAYLQKLEAHSISIYPAILNSGY